MDNTHQILIRALGEAAGIPDLEFDESGHCALSFDDRVLDFEHIEATDCVLVYGKVGELPDAGRSDALARLFELSSAAALSGKGCFAADRDTGTIFLVDRIAVTAMTDSAFQAAVERILDDAEYWAAKLNDIIRNNNPAEDGPPPAEEFALRV